MKEILDNFRKNLYHPCTGYSDIDEYFKNKFQKYFLHPIRYSTENRFRELDEYFGKGNIPKEYLQKFIKDSNKDYILENLQSHDWKTLAKALKSRFSEIYEIVPYTPSDSEEESGKKGVFIKVRGTRENKTEDILKKLPINSDFIKIIEFYGYYVSSVEENIYLEPKYAEDATEYIRSKCHGVGYHITSKENVESIEQHGLRIRTGDLPKSGRERKEFKNYREFPKRIYFVAEPPGEGLTRQRLLKLADEVIPGGRKNAAIFMIGGLTGNVYRDPGMPERQDAFYTYQNIPPEKLQRIW